LEGHLAFQDYAVAKWFYHVNAFIDTGPSLLNKQSGDSRLLQEISYALDDFLTRYDENWDAHIVEECKDKCSGFKNEDFYENLVAVASHIYTFQKKGFDARHVVSIKSLANAIERNRKLLEELPKNLRGTELEQYRQFYDDEHRYKCTKITCMYFAEGFKDAKTRKRHVNLHDRPFHCEVLGCLGAESGFTNANDLEKQVSSTALTVERFLIVIDTSELSTLKRSISRIPSNRQPSSVPKHNGYVIFVTSISLEISICKTI
jgi:hypothetical protein